MDVFRDDHYFQIPRQSLRCGRNLRKHGRFQRVENYFRQTHDSCTIIRHILYKLRLHGGVPVVEWRASMIIGSGSLSFEIIRALVERLPVMVTPRWVRVMAQPLAVTDVLAYLRAALSLEISGSVPKSPSVPSH